MNINETLSQGWQTITDNLFTYLAKGLVILITLILSKLILNQLSKYTNKIIEKAKSSPESEKSKRLVTSLTVLRSVLRYLIYFIVAVIILNQLGLGSVVNNVLVTAGIGSLMISFGAQSIVSDVVAGIFLMFENQFAVGDRVKIGDYEGTVTAIAMRVTYLKNLQGQTIIIPNGKIASVINYSTDFSLASLTVPTAFEQNTEEAIQQLQEICQEYYNDHPDIFIEPIQILGVSKFNDSSVDIDLCAKVKPLQNLKVERELRLLIKQRFDEKGIEIPYQKIEIIK